ncbi:hypothetical protein ES703_50325 [subsurface metagenome]
MSLLSSGTSTRITLKVCRLALAKHQTDYVVVCAGKAKRGKKGAVSKELVAI